MEGKVTGCFPGMQVMIEGQWYQVTDVRKHGRTVRMKRISEPPQVKKKRKEFESQIDPNMPRIT